MEKTRRGRKRREVTEDVDPVVKAEILKSKLEESGFLLSEYNDFTDEVITDEIITALRDHKIAKPPHVTVGRWVQPRNELTPRHKMVVHLRAMGKTTPQIAEETGFAESTVRNLLASPLVKQKVVKHQDNLFMNDARMHMKVLMNKSFAVVEEILESYEEKASVKLEAAKFVIDHVVGKATQTHEVKTNLLAEFITKLDVQVSHVQQRNERILNTPEEPEYTKVEVDQVVADEESATALKVIAPIRDNMDTLVNSLLGDTDFVVGRRGGGGTDSEKGPK